MGEHRNIIGKKLQSAQNDLMQTSDDKNENEKKLTKIVQVSSDKEMCRAHQPARTSDDIPVKMTTGDDIGNLKSLTKALDSAIIPLSSAVGIYSGAGGYSAYRPGLVGLTPSQLREMKKFEEDTSLEHHQFLLAPSISSDV